MTDQVKKCYKKNYTVADNKVIQDERLSYLAIGIFMYLWSKPDDWKVVVHHLMQRNNTSERQTRKALRELRDCGYVRWQRVQSGCIYEITDSGEFHCDHSDHDQIEHDHNDHDIYIQNKDNNKVKNITKTIYKAKNFVKPTLEEIKAYCAERNNQVNPEAWLDHYTSNGWKVGRNPMKDWKAAIRTWEKNKYPSQTNSKGAYDNKTGRQGTNTYGTDFNKSMGEFLDS